MHFAKRCTAEDAKRGTGEKKFAIEAGATPCTISSTYSVVIPIISPVEVRAKCLNPSAEEDVVSKYEAGGTRGEIEENREDVPGFRVDGERKGFTCAGRASWNPDKANHPDKFARDYVRT